MLYSWTPTPHPCHAMLYHVNCGSFHHIILFLLVAYDLFDCAMYLLWPHVCLVFIQINAEQGEYQEPHEYLPDPSYSAAEILGKKFPMFALHVVRIASVLFLHHESRHE